jgi:carbamoyl-phosphate synthase/aspartate carbamoyltransferase/dihydroorotase
LDDRAAIADHFRRWPRRRPLVVHAEGEMAALAIALAEESGRPVHIAHVSTRREIETIVAAKERGALVTCEVTPHHLWLCDADATALGGFGDVRPRLATADDRAALWAHLDAIDCIATDHAPHTREEKALDRPPPGMPGLETALPLALTAVQEGRLSLDRVVELMSTTPARLFGVATPAAAQVEVEFGPAWTLPEAGYQTLVDWSPFAGMRVRGRVAATRLRGALAWDGQAVQATPGSGRVVRGNVMPHSLERQGGVE